MAFRGNLAGMDLEEVFGFLGGNGSEGTLEVRSGDAASIRLYFRPEGMVFFPFSARRGTYSLGKLLRHTGVLSREGLASYLAEVRRQRKAELLREEAGEADLEEAKRRQFLEELHDLFLWRDAQYEFRPGPLPPRVAQDLEAGRGLTFQPTSLLFEVARRKDERRRIQQVIPSSRLVLQARPGAGVAVVEALRAGGIEVEADPFSGDLNLDDLLARWGVPHHEALNAVAALIETGQLLLLTAPQARERIAGGLERGDAEAVTRLLGHLLELERRGAPGSPAPFELGVEADWVASSEFQAGEERSCAMRLGGGRTFRLIHELLARRLAFTAALVTGGQQVVCVGLPGEVRLACSEPPDRSLWDLLVEDEALSAAEAERLRAIQEDPAGQVDDEAWARAALRQLAERLAGVVLWADVDVTLTNRARALPSDDRPLVVAIDAARHQHLWDRLADWHALFEQVPGEDVMFLPGRKHGKGPAARFLGRFSLRRSLGELRREAKAGPLEFLNFSAKALVKGFLRRPELFELQAALASARGDDHDVWAYKVARAGLALGFREVFAPALQAFQGREPVLYGAPALQGDLDGIGLAAVLQALHDQRRTGSLVIEAGGREESLCFRRGEAFVLRAQEDEAGEAFLDFFLGDEGEEQVSALAQAGGPGFAPHGELSVAEMRELKDDLLDLLFWEDARFTFHPDDLPEGFFQPERERVDKIPLETRGFLLEAMHHMDEWDRIREWVPGVGVVFRFREGRKGQEVARRAQVASLLMLVDGRRSVRDLVRASGEPLLEVAGLLALLVRDDALEQVEVAASAG